MGEFRDEEKRSQLQNLQMLSVVLSSVALLCL